MIKTIADLLENLRLEEAKMLDAQDISHPPTIGAMYEGLTENILRKSIPSGVGLEFVSGFISNNKGETSQQIDCMLVKGDGEQIPYSNFYRYPIEDVIAVIEVKKNLYTSQLDSSYKNLRSVKTLLRDYEFPPNRLYDDAYTGILGEKSISLADSEMPVWKKNILYVLHRESITPIRIVLGYHGFSSELSFRNAFIDYMGNNLNTRGYGPGDLPNLIVVDSYSLIKLNGMPYSMRIVEDATDLLWPYGITRQGKSEAPINGDLWPLYSSFSGNPMILLLELIWTRLRYFESITLEGFDSNLDIENLKPLLLAKAIEIDDQPGWYFESINLHQNELNLFPVAATWQPVILNDSQADVLAEIIRLTNEEHDEIDLAQQKLVVGSIDVDESIIGLKRLGLVSVTGNLIHLLTHECQIYCLPDGRIVAGENTSGRLTAWVQKFMEDFDD